ncbi:MAG TPA: LLM class flavin-dependent oxidoreductase [Actinomycetota bacterium]|nr:LLM class flavin-dependent oxidoreductase [Actinomycetota bacterium]
MKYGLCLPNGGVCDPRTLGELAKRAEDTGWDAVFIEDYIAYQSMGIDTYDPWVCLASMALHTNTVLLGTLVTPPSRRRPWKLAAEAVSIDHLSNGRLILGVGLGDINEPGFTAVGEQLDARVRAELLDESLAILDGLWTGEPFSFQGKHFTVNELTLKPRPLQRPRIPIWVGGGWPNAGLRRRLPRWDGSCAYKHPPESDQYMTPDDVRALARLVERERGSLDGYEIAVGGSRRGDDWDRERKHIAAVEEAGATYWMEWAPPGELETMRSLASREPLRP